jgi:hypothetical protein
VQILIRALYAIFVRKKVCICGHREVLCPQITEKLGPQIVNPESVTLAEGSQILQTTQVHKFADLRLKELIC